MESNKTDIIHSLQSEGSLTQELQSKSLADSPLWGFCVLFRTYVSGLAYGGWYEKSAAGFQSDWPIYLCAFDTRLSARAMG